MAAKQLLLSISILFFCSSAYAGDIAFGTLKGIKVYDLPTNQTIHLYFDDDATYQVEASCNGVARITPSQHDEQTVQRWLSLALSAQMAGRKIRAYSSNAGSCEAELISVQEAYF